MGEHIKHLPDQHRFSMMVDEFECFIDYSIAGANVWDFKHTFVPPELRGRKLAEILTTQALNYIRDHDLKVIPTCPYISRFIGLNPEYENLVFKK